MPFTLRFEHAAWREEKNVCAVSNRFSTLFVTPIAYADRSSGQPTSSLEWTEDDFVSRCQQLDLTSSEAMSQPANHSSHRSIREALVGWKPVLLSSIDAFGVSRDGFKLVSHYC